MTSEKTYESFLGLFVAAVAFLAYSNSLGNGFAVDDNSVILNNPALKGSILSLFNRIDTTSDTLLLPFYRPFTYLTFLIEGRLHGFNPFFIRLFNVLLHTANTFLVYRLAKSFFKDNLYAALLASLLFAVHPLHSEGVDFNAGGRNTMLACFFSIATYLLHNRSTIQNNISWAFIGAVMFLAGLFSKETALMVLPLIAAREITQLRGNLPKTGLLAFLRFSPYLGAAACYIVMRWLTLSKLGIQTSIIPGIGTKLLENMYVTTDLDTRLLNNLYIIPRYLLTVIWPTALSSRQVIPDDLNLLALPLAVAWLGIIGCLAWLLTKGRSTATLFGLSWIILFWLPVSGIVYVPGAPLADRFLYIPAIGLWLVVADQAGRTFLADKQSLRRYGLIAVAIILLVLTGLTIRRNQDWKNDVTLYTRFVEQYPDNVHAHTGLGNAYYYKSSQQNISLAEREFEIAIAMDPFLPMIHTFLGNIKLNKEDLIGAMFHYDKAIEIYPYDKEAHLNRGVTLEKLGRQKDALMEYLFFLTTPGSSDNLPGGRQHAEQRIRELSR